MNNHRSEVRCGHAHAVAEYRVVLRRSPGDFNSVGYWTIVDPGVSPRKVLGRGDTDELAWAVAALSGQFDSDLSEPDRRRPELRAD